jgi:hypothetical protein
MEGKWKASHELICTHNFVYSKILEFFPVQEDTMLMKIDKSNQCMTVNLCNELKITVNSPWDSFLLN